MFIHIVEPPTHSDRLRVEHLISPENGQTWTLTDAVDDDGKRAPGYPSVSGGQGSILHGEPAQRLWEALLVVAGEQMSRPLAASQLAWLLEAHLATAPPQRDLRWKTEYKAIQLPYKEAEEYIRMILKSDA